MIVYYDDDIVAIPRRIVKPVTLKVRPRRPFGFEGVLRTKRSVARRVNIDAVPPRDQTSRRGDPPEAITSGTQPLDRNDKTVKYTASNVKPQAQAPFLLAMAGLMRLTFRYSKVTRRSLGGLMLTVHLMICRQI